MVTIKLEMHELKYFSNRTCLNQDNGQMREKQICTPTKFDDHPKARAKIGNKCEAVSNYLHKHSSKQLFLHVHVCVTKQ